MGQIFLRIILLFPVRTNPPVLHMHLHLHVALTKRRKGRSLPTKQKAFAGIGEHWREKYSHYFRLKVCAMTEVVSREPLTTEARLRSQLSPCEIYGKQSGTRIGFSPSTSVLSCQYHSTKRSLPQTDHSFRGVLPNVARRCV